MKNLTKLAIALLLFVAITISCNREDNIEPITKSEINNSNEKGIDLSGGLQIEFPFLENIYEDKEIAISEGNIKLHNFFDELYELEDSLSENKNFLGIDFKLEHLEYSIEVTKITPINNTKLLSVSSCPSGMKKYKTCTSRSCAEGAIRNLTDNMQPGDGISVHRGIFGVTICANQALIDRTLANQR